VSKRKKATNLPKLRRSDLRPLSKVHPVSWEEAEKAVALLWQLAGTGAAKAALIRAGQSKEPTMVSTAALLESLAPSIGPMYLPKYESRAIGQIDRMGSLVGGLPYVTDEFPWPVSGQGEFMVPLSQLDLAEISRATGKDVGDGLLQLWRLRAGDWNFGENELRHIPGSAVRQDATLRQMPEQFAAQVGEEWQQHVVRPRLLDELFEEESVGKEDYLANLYFRGLLWGDRELEHKETDPWWAGGEYAGNGPWQIVDWVDHGYSLPGFELVDLMFSSPSEMKDEASYEEPEFLRLEKETGNLLKEADRAWSALVKRTKCWDSLFGIGRELLEGNEFGRAPLVGGWQPLFNLYGPATGSAFVDFCSIYHRKVKGQFEYQAWSEGFRWS
jgi:hypothetical protein